MFVDDSVSVARHGPACHGLTPPAGMLVALKTMTLARGSAARGGAGARHGVRAPEPVAGAQGEAERQVAARERGRAWERIAA